MGTTGGVRRRSPREDRSTYFVKQNLSPKWDGQDFVMDLTPDHAAAKDYHVSLRVMDFDLLGDELLGSVAVPLAKLANEAVRTNHAPAAHACPPKTG